MLSASSSLTLVSRTLMGTYCFNGSKKLIPPVYCHLTACESSHHQKRSVGYRKSRSFLCDKEGVKTFVDLLGYKERQMLLEELHYRDQFHPTAHKESTDRESTPVTPPTTKQLTQIMLHQSLPFIGFGFLGNLIMILAGDYIDYTIGATLGISTMAAAGLGNAISEVAGVGSTWYVEYIANKVGVPNPNISPEQADLTVTRWAVQIGRVIGVFLGCIIGMFPLLFMHRDEKNKN